jgi:DNA-binding transcriptional LysR family regulator
MRVDQLNHFRAVVRTGSIRRAAELSHLSQPALSESLANLERELGVSLLDRARSGAKISEAGRELLPRILEILDGVDELREAADERRRSTRVLHVGTVNAATVSLLAPAVRIFAQRHPGTEVEIVNARSEEIDLRLREGSFDIGLVNRLVGDDPPAGEFDVLDLLHGHPVVCFPADSPLADYDAIPVSELIDRPLVAMRTGFVMNRYLRRLFQHIDAEPTIVCYADGAEMGKVMVADGTGITLLPDYSIAGDPLHRSGLIDYRPVAANSAEAQSSRIALQARVMRTRYTSTPVRTMLGVLSEVAATNSSRLPPARTSR